MKINKNGLIPKWLEKVFFVTIDPLIDLVVKLGITPNTFTVLGLVLSCLGALFIAIGKIRLGGLFILLGGICDVLDGKVARKSNTATKFGALLDSSLDRYAEVFMFLGVAIFLERNEFFLSSIMIFIALGGSTMVSYVRARAEGLGYDCKIGIMQRPERVIIVSAGALIHPYALIATIWIIALLSNFTAFQRMRFVYQLEKIEKAENNN